jgi:hypothetical protein
VESNGSVLNSYLYLGEYDKFLRSLPEASDSSIILFYRGLGEYYQHNLQLAAKDFDQAYAMEISLYTQIGKALSASMIHREMDGLQSLHALESKIAERGVGDPEATYKIAQAYAVLGDKASALRILRRNVESGFFCYPYFTTDPLLNILRGEPEFKSILEIARLRHESFKRVFLEYVSLCPSVVTWCSFPTSTSFRLAFLMGLAAAAAMGPVNMLAIHRGVIGGWHTLACGIGSITGHLILFSLIHLQPLNHDSLGGRHLQLACHRPFSLGLQRPRVGNSDGHFRSQVGMDLRGRSYVSLEALQPFSTN